MLVHLRNYVVDKIGGKLIGQKSKTNGKQVQYWSPAERSNDPLTSEVTRSLWISLDAKQQISF